MTLPSGFFKVFAMSVPQELILLFSRNFRLSLSMTRFDIYFVLVYIVQQMGLLCSIYQDFCNRTISRTNPQILVKFQITLVHEFNFLFLHFSVNQLTDGAVMCHLLTGDFCRFLLTAYKTITADSNSFC